MSRTGVISAGPQQPGATPLVIGGVTFRAIETPDVLPIGAVRQMVVAKTLPGGTRIVQTFGVEPTDVSWSGNLWDSNVTDRVETLRSYSVDGQERLLTWGSERYYCIVKDFTPRYYHDYHAVYEITVTITRDANGALTVAQATSVDSQVSSLANLANTQLTAAQAASMDAALQVEIPAALTNVNVALQQSGPLAQLNGSSLTSFVTTVQQALYTVQAYQQTLSSTASWYSNVAQIASSLQLIIANVNRGQSPKTVQVQGGSLYGLAAKFYGDPTLAFQLASANGLATPQLSSTVTQTLVLPPLG